MSALQGHGHEWLARNFELGCTMTAAGGRGGRKAEGARAAVAAVQQAAQAHRRQDQWRHLIKGSISCAVCCAVEG